MSRFALARPLGVVINLQRHLSCLGAPSTVDETVGRGVSFMSDPTQAALSRLLRRIGREASRFERWSADAFARGSVAYAETCAKEANALRMTQGFVRDEMRRASREREG